MKKTIAILMILVLAGVGLFATGVEGNTTGNDATIQITTAVTGRALFGVSAAALTTNDYADWSTFTNAVVEDLTVASVDIDQYKVAKQIGFISGFNSTDTSFLLKASASPLTDGAYEIPLTLTLGGTVATSATRIEVPGVTLGIRGTLPSVKVEVTGDSAAIGLAPVGTYTSTITFEVTAT